MFVDEAFTSQVMYTHTVKCYLTFVLVWSWNTSLSAIPIATLESYDSKNEVLSKRRRYRNHLKRSQRNIAHHGHNDGSLRTRSFDYGLLDVAFKMRWVNRTSKNVDARMRGRWDLPVPPRYLQSPFLHLHVDDRLLHSRLFRSGQARSVLDAITLD